MHVNTSEVAFRCIYTLFNDGINAFTLQLLHNLMPGAEVGLSRHNLVWLLCGTLQLH